MSQWHGTSAGSLESSIELCLNQRLLHCCAAAPGITVMPLHPATSTKMGFASLITVDTGSSRQTWAASNPPNHPSDSLNMRHDMSTAHHDAPTYNPKPCNFSASSRAGAHGSWRIKASVSPRKRIASFVARRPLMPWLSRNARASLTPARLRCRLQQLKLMAPLQRMQIIRHSGQHVRECQNGGLRARTINESVGHAWVTGRTLQLCHLHQQYCPSVCRVTALADGTGVCAQHTAGGTGSAAGQAAHRDWRPRRA